MKAAHCAPYHSHSSLSRECVGSLTDRTRYTARYQLPRARAWARLYCQDPSHFREINNLPRVQNQLPRPRMGGLRPRHTAYSTSEIYAKKSALNCSNPLSVNTCLAILSKTLGGIVHISAPNSKDLPTDCTSRIRAANT